MEKKIEIEKVTDGTFETPTSATEEMKAFLEACERPEEIQDIQENNYPVQRFHKFVKGWKCRKIKQPLPINILVTTKQVVY